MNKTGGPATAPATHLPAVATGVGVAGAAIAARFARLGFVHLDVSALEVRTVELRDSRGSLVRTRHLDETKALRLAGKLVHYDRCTLHSTGL
jgi:hypothetical protein